MGLQYGIINQLQFYSKYLGNHDLLSKFCFSQVRHGHCYFFFETEFKGALLSMRQFFATGSPLKII